MFAQLAEVSEIVMGEVLTLSSHRIVWIASLLSREVAQVQEDAAVVAEELGYSMGCTADATRTFSYRSTSSLLRNLFFVFVQLTPRETSYEAVDVAVTTTDSVG